MTGTLDSLTESSLSFEPPTKIDVCFECLCGGGVGGGYKKYEKTEMKGKVRKQRAC